MNRVAIIDYNMGNLDSVARAVEECGGKPLITCQYSDLEKAERFILPGVGSFADGMKHIRERGLDEILTEQVIDKKIPFLGICLGMQLLADVGTEGGKTKGLGWIPGTIEKLVSTTQWERIPHIGWNSVEYSSTTPLFKNIPSGTDYYFVHSYHFVCRDNSHIVAETPYAGKFTSVVGREHIFGVQFHPEKSQKVGFKVLKNFLDYELSC